MKLVELSPQWILREGQRVGILFRCPHCLYKAPRQWLMIFNVPQASISGPDGQYSLVTGMIPDDELAQAVPSRRNFAWQFTGDTFDALSIVPSVDASSSGHWHGYITNGEVK